MAGPPFVLVVDDSMTIRRQTQMLLSAYRVETRNSARGALELLGTERPDVVLLDDHLPDTVVTEFLARLESDEVLRRVPVIVMTERGGGEPAAPGHEHRSVVGVLVKPLSADALLEAVEAAVLAGAVADPGSGPTPAQVEAVARALAGTFARALAKVPDWERARGPPPRASTSASAVHGPGGRSGRGPAPRRGGVRGAAPAARAVAVWDTQPGVRPELTGWFGRWYRLQTIDLALAADPLDAVARARPMGAVVSAETVGVERCARVVQQLAGAVPDRALVVTCAPANKNRAGDWWAAGAGAVLVKPFALRALEPVLVRECPAVH
ncbi:response regulator [Frigoriglobus tundricola]|uniref:Response regulatory domain-containing protein n=1 Tax=Frigoriglobus tundricola TaxID=2774151 RepID=A0A6M5YL10_9BACT|nr:response regulator [Frigoriglobus tundricola]QJW94779.1 hypothetical protein FTUN_2302 [Frigoriglobus tundricola]